MHHQGAPASARRELWKPRDDKRLDPMFDEERQALFRRPTDLDLFLALRRRWFQEKDHEDKEVFAQAATAMYADFLREVYGPRPGGRKSLHEIFWELMQFQPREYRLQGIVPKGLEWRIGGGVIREGVRKDWERVSMGSFIISLQQIFKPWEGKTN